MDKLPVIKIVAERWNTLAKEQKISAVLLGVCGIIVLVFQCSELARVFEIRSRFQR